MWKQEPEGPPPAGELVRLLPSDFSLAGLSELELVADIWSADAREARCHAQKALAVTALARRRRAGRDAAFGARGGPGRDARSLRSAVLAEVSEDFVTELALIRQCSEHEAATLAVESLLLVDKLPHTWGELNTGRIGIGKARAMIELLGDACDDLAAAVEARVLPDAERLTTSAFRDRVRYHLYRLDAQAAQRRRRAAEQKADVHLWPGGDGVSQLVLDLPTPQAVACRDAIGTYARWLRADGDTRPIGVLRAAAAADLILRPWDTSRPPVTAQLTIHAPLPALRPDPGRAQPPAELDGQPITAAHCRDLLTDLRLLGLRPAPTGSSIAVAVEHPVTGEVLAVATPAELRRAAGQGRTRTRRHLTRSGAPPDPGAPAPDAPDGPGLRPPPPTSAYRPTAAQRRLVTTRDRHCRMPGCRRRPGRCDIDHGRAHADGGPTDCANLCCLCRRHHRIKTLAPGWRFTLLPDGRLVVRTPAGISRTTRPPGWCHDPEPDPPWLDEQAPPDPAHR